MSCLRYPWARASAIPFFCQRQKRSDHSIGARHNKTSGAHSSLTSMSRKVSAWLVMPRWRARILIELVPLVWVRDPVAELAWVELASLGTAKTRRSSKYDSGNKDLVIRLGQPEFISGVSVIRARQAE